MSQTTLRLDDEAEQLIPALMEHLGERTMNGAMNKMIKGFLILNKSNEDRGIRIRKLESEYARLRSLLLRKVQIDREIEELANSTLT